MNTTGTASRIRIGHRQLEDLATAIFVHCRMPEAHARISARALVTADLRGHESHGVSNYIKTIYEPGLTGGHINPDANPRIVHETPTTARWDADGAMGHVAGELAMRDCIERARRYGVGFAAVADSRHYGAAQVYALQALEHDMVGISMTNGVALTVPFQGRDPKLGTNPIAVAIPAGDMPPFVLDMATTTVAMGKVLNAARDGRSIPIGWAIDTRGMPTTDPHVAIDAARLLPLGGTTEGSAHKGYGLAAWVEIFCGVLSGTGFGVQLARDNVGHFFGAMRIDAFYPVADFKQMMDQLLRDLMATRPAPGFDRVVYAGLLEWECEQDRRAHGIPLHPTVVEMLREYGQRAGSPIDLT